MSFADPPSDLVVPGEVPSIVLRDYQEKAKSAVLAARDRGLHRVMVVMPTGTGKTTLFASLVDEFDRIYNESSLVVAHRSELLHQAANRIRLMAPRLSVGIEGGPLRADEESRVVVAGVQSVGRPDSKRLPWFHPGLLIMDEGHHAPADTWQNVLRRFGSYEGTCFTLAVTATDHRMDNRPLHGSEEAIFEDVVFRYQLRQAVADGWLVDLRGYRVATGTDLSKVKKVRGDFHQAELARAVNTEERNFTAFMHWSDIAKDRRTIVFCVDVQHAKDVAELYRSHHIAAEHVDGTMKADVRAGIMRRFGRGDTQVLVNVDVATEGFDVPHVSCVLMLRPTQSWGLYAQMAGRGVRTLPGIVEGSPNPISRRRAIDESDKPDCIVIDVVDLAGKFSLVGPDDKEDKKPIPATVAGLVGLPADFDLQGHSIFEAATMVDDVGPLKRAQLFRRPMSFDDIDTVLTEVDLLRELSIPEEIVGHTALAWLKTGEGEYALPCGSSGFERDRLARISVDVLGRYSLTLSSTMMEYPPLPLGEDLAKVFDEADRFIRMTWSDCVQIVRADARWREQPPTDRQVDTLRRMSVPEDVIALCATAGQARSLIEQHKLGNGRKRRRAEKPA
ncbi:DEAD/DEAH box helicase [Fimbriimonas ginsengisoli]|uniref:DEAD box family helicase n=1 Tax=Fimbriimonas ginsengisoli Gsoil 348 TaxID=661478 RepID=A0A068NS99_FIMGI|nr:DEAD/DEAH box helicase [Fimbriimonas ginsengisoli]AIE86423.1 DEAD box family helicase [Fimbriimonas ginsengisoli Gsoil 348]